MTTIEPRKNQRKTPLTPKKRDAEETSTILTSMRIGGGRIKKAKIPFDPSENYVPKRRMTTYIPSTKAPDAYSSNIRETTECSPTSPTVSTLRDYHRKFRPTIDKSCFFCSKYDFLKATIQCRDCTVAAHLSCIRSNGGPFLLIDEKNWSCPNCEICLDCYETGHLKPLYKCRLCFNPYHLDCHNLNSKVKSRKSFFQCRNCLQYNIPTPTSTTKKSKFNNNIKTNRPLMVNFKEENQTIKRNDTTIDDNSYQAKKIQQQIGFAGFQLDELTNKTNQTTDINIKDDTEDNDINDNNSSIEANPIIINNNPIINEFDNSSEIQDNNEPLFTSINVDDYQTANEIVPDTSTWNCDDVYNYFYKYFPNDAHILRDEEIDGNSLLLMKRSDLFTLDLKLGVALNMFLHILKFQTRQNDIKMAWA